MTNCLLWSIKLWIKRKLIGYIVLRKSKWGNFPHFLYAEKRNNKIRMYSYVPVNPKHKQCPPPLFKGKVKWGD